MKQMEPEIIALYRDWILEITGDSATATKDGERFECYRQPSAEDALRAVVRKVERLEGPEKWDPNYKDEALR